MRRISAIFLIFFATISIAKVVTSGTCQQCQTENDIYCANTTSYYYCMGTERENEMFTCPDGKVCTNNADEVCILESDTGDTDKQNVCSGVATSDCGTCKTGQRYTCVSNRQYARCPFSESGPWSTCPEGQVCLSALYNDHSMMCAPSCALSFLTKLLSLDEPVPTCSNDDLTTAAPPTTVATTPQPNVLRTTCTEAVIDDTSLASYSFFYTKYGTGCTEYVYCERDDLTSNTDWTAALYLKCKAAKPYFDSKRRSCVVDRPTGC